MCVCVWGGGGGSAERSMKGVHTADPLMEKNVTVDFRCV